MQRLSLHIAIILVFACINAPAQKCSEALLKLTKRGLVDKKATDKTAALFYNLQKSADTHILFGQQDYASDGFGFKNTNDRCDVKEITGAYPAINCLDFLHYTNVADKEKKDTAYLRKIVYNTYNRGGIITYCWHYYNPVTGGLFYDTTIVVKHILPGGSHHEKFKKDLKIIGDFAKSLVTKDGDLIPFIFRPWHEFDGQWFWWGKPHCTAEEFKALYRFTVTYLRDSLQVHNILYAFSPDVRFHSEADYLERFPGNEYVDLVGMDNYWDFIKGDGVEGAILKTQIISDYAQKHNKLAAITETGLKDVADTSWYTQKLMRLLKAPGVRLAYVAAWRGEYVPHRNHPARFDFINFYKDPLIVFEDGLKDMYHIQE